MKRRQLLGFSLFLMVGETLYAARLIEDITFADPEISKHPGPRNAVLQHLLAMLVSPKEKLVAIEQLPELAANGLRLVVKKKAWFSKRRFVYIRFTKIQVLGPSATVQTRYVSGPVGAATLVYKLRRSAGKWIVISYKPISIS